MEVAVGSRWQPMVEDLVREGRYSSVEDVVTEGLRLLDQREARLAELKTMIAMSIAHGGDNSDEDVGAAIDAKLASMVGVD